MAKNFIEEDKKNQKLNIPLGKYSEVDTRSIKDNSNQTRTNEDEKEYQNRILLLSKDIEKNGLINPITLAKNINSKDEEYELIAGSRRLEAFKLSNKSKSLIPSIVFILDSTESDYEFIKYLITISENLKRENNIPIDEIRAIANLKIKFKKMDVKEIAKYVGISERRVHDYFNVAKDEIKIKNILLKSNVELNHVKSKIHLINLANLIRNKENEERINQYINNNILKKEKTISPISDGKTENQTKQKTEYKYTNSNFAIDFNNPKKIVINASKSKNKEFINPIKNVINEYFKYDDDTEFAEFLSQKETLTDRFSSLMDELKKEYKKQKMKIS